MAAPKREPAWKGGSDAPPLPTSEDTAPIMSTKLPVALQLYTVRDEAARDFAGTIKAVAEIGYAGVEVAGYGSLTAGEVKRILDDNGLFVAGIHTGLEAMENDLGSVIESAVTLGSEFVVCPYIADNRRATLDDYRQVGASLDRIGGELKSADLQLAYHNHAFEFDRFGGEAYAYDVLMEVTDPERVQIEMDTFWVQKGGEDPAAYLRKYASRVPLIHLKDMTAAPENDFAEVGEGIMDFDAIFDAALTAGGRYYIVEQDRCKNHAPLESAAISLRNLQKMGMA